MATIVGVHGIMQQQLGRHQLIDEWGPALADGIERAVGHRVAVPPLDVAFYGDLFLPGSLPAGSKGLVQNDLADLTDEDIAALTPHVEEAVGPGRLVALDEIVEEAATKGFTKSPLLLQRLLRSLDRRFGSRAASRMFLGELRQVRRYLLNATIKAEADERTATAIGEDARVVIGHSLGSVVAFEYLRQHRERQIGLLLTLGSPLGLQTVRKLMPDPTYGEDWLPGNVSRWVNLRDRHDPVACAGDLSRWWPGITDDDSIQNQTDAHSIERYLGKEQTGQAILETLPEVDPKALP